MKKQLSPQRGSSQLLQPAIIAVACITIIITGWKMYETNVASHVDIGESMKSRTTLDLYDPTKKDIAMKLVSSAENSSLDWRRHYGYIEYNVEDNDAESRGYTGGIIGFTSATGDMLALVKQYDKLSPGNILSKYIPALEAVNGTPSKAGLGSAFTADWQKAATDRKFTQAQDYLRDKIYFDPAVTLAKRDGLHALGQFAYYDAAVMHGPDAWGGGLIDIRNEAIKHATPPAQGGDEAKYLNAFLDARKAEMQKESGHSDTDRVDTMQRKFLREHNFDLQPPLDFSIYGDDYMID